MSLDELRQQEDEKIAKHLKEIANIVLEKCNRCQNMYGCMGCVVSPGDGIKGYVRESMKMMITQRYSLENELEEFIHKLEH